MVQYTQMSTSGHCFVQKMHFRLKTSSASGFRVYLEFWGGGGVLAGNTYRDLINALILLKVMLYRSIDNIFSERVI